MYLAKCVKVEFKLEISVDVALSECTPTGTAPRKVTSGFNMFKEAITGSSPLNVSKNQCKLFWDHKHSTALIVIVCLLQKCLSFPLILPFQ